ncbi:hypothetical protein [Streptomyces sp. NPDC008137]|uniref:hypothetical protein n=1 Tax=Streptomyces sp. NPDC008137 TaxID=3364813 RepID=UPI0036ECDE9B
MRGTVRLTCAAGLVVGALTTGLTACVGEPGGGGADKAEACADGAYAWSGVRREQRLTALSGPIRFKERTATYSALLKPLGDTVYRPSVTGRPEGADIAGVIKALGRHLKVDEPLAGPSETERPAQDHFFESATGEHLGAYYAWASIDLVEADFTHTCGDGEPAKGHVRTWEGTGAGFLPCSMPSDEEAGRLAAQRTCPAGSEAAKEA